MDLREIKVLIVDDEQICIDALTDSVDWETLGINKKNIFEANSVKHAKAVIQQMQEQPSIIISDVEMPNGNGIEFIEWVTERNRLEGIMTECIILTCHPDFSYVRRALQLGCKDYILKPYAVEDIEKVIKRAVEHLNEEERMRDKKPVQQSTSKDMYMDMVFGKVIPYINEHLTESFSVEDIAKYVSLNPQYLMRRFKRETGTSLLAYVVDERIKLAQKLLIQTDWPIEIITDKVGYLSSAHFGQLFKRVVGKTPGQYRKQYRK